MTPSRGPEPRTADEVAKLTAAPAAPTDRKVTAVRTVNLSDAAIEKIANAVVAKLPQNSETPTATPVTVSTASATAVATAVAASLTPAPVPAPTPAPTATNPAPTGST